MGVRTRTVVSFFWALLSLLTFGLASPLIFIFAAIRLRTAFHWIAALAYPAALVTLLASAESTGPVGDVVFTAAGVTLWLVGTAHAFGIRTRVFGLGPYENAIAMAERRQEIRSEARRTAREDPSMAWELRIGRPDLPRAFDDGGLIDVNHAPPSALASLPGRTPDLVNRILRTRNERGGLVSVEELSALAQLPATLTPQLDEFAIFLP